MTKFRFTVQQPGVAIRCKPAIDAAQLSQLCRGDEIVTTEVFVEDGIEWVKLPKGSMATRVNGKTSKVTLDLAEDGFVPTMDPIEGMLLHKHTQVMVEDKKEEGVLSRSEIQAVLDRCSDPSILLPLESKYWTKQQLEMFVMSGGSIRPAHCSIPDERLLTNTNMTKEEIVRSVVQAARWITDADALIIGSGAGMGVDSGLGTFRGNKKGVWDGLEAVGLAYEDICQPKWFKEEPHLGWAFWNFCHEAYQATTPHEGYVRAREWGQRCPLGFFSFTSNIDSHWISSGTSSENVLEVHGAVKWLQCSKPCCPDVWRAPKDLGLEEDKETHRVRGILPSCPKCKAVARPNVQMFGGDSGFSKARRSQQMGRYDGWLKQLEARPDKDSLRVTIVEVGCGLTVATVRNELEGVMKKFRESRLIRINPENPGLSTDFAHRGVSLPMGAGFALQELGKQVFQETGKVITYVLWGITGGCELRAPYGICLGRLLRLCEMEEGMSVEFAKETKAVAQMFGGKQGPDIELRDIIDWSAFSEVKAGAGPGMEVTAILRVGAVFKSEKRSSNLSDKFQQRVDSVCALLAEINGRFEDEAYQKRVQQCTTKRELTQLMRSVQFAVLPKHGIEGTEKGTVIMAAWIASGQVTYELHQEVEKSMAMSGIRRLNELPADRQSVREVPRPTPAEPLQVTCVAMPAEDGHEIKDSCLIEATTKDAIWEVRGKLAAALGWDEETTRGVRFFEKLRGNSYVGMKDTEQVRKVLYVRNCPPLRGSIPVDVMFKEMAPEDGQPAKQFSLSVSSEDSIMVLRQKLGQALGWDAQTREAGVRFLIKVAKDSFGALKDHEKVHGRRIIYVHGASLEPNPEGLPTQEEIPSSDRAEANAYGEQAEQWEEEEVEESDEVIEVEIILDATANLSFPLAVKKGTSIAALKQVLADGDPTQSTTVDSFWLKPMDWKTSALPDSRRLKEGCRLEVVTEPPPRPSPPRPRIARAAPSPTVPVQTYFVVGSWSDWKPEKMTREGSSSFVHTFEVGKNGWESFQILLGGNWDTTFHPNIQDANPFVKYTLQGPDNQGHGLNWTLGLGPAKNKVKPGTQFKIVVRVNDKQVATKVTWLPVL